LRLKIALSISIAQPFPLKPDFARVLAGHVPTHAHDQELDSRGHSSKDHGPLETIVDIVRQLESTPIGVGVLARMVILQEVSLAKILDLVLCLRCQEHCSDNAQNRGQNRHRPPENRKVLGQRVPFEKDRDETTHPQQSIHARGHIGRNLGSRIYFLVKDRQRKDVGQERISWRWNEDPSIIFFPLSLLPVNLDPVLSTFQRLAAPSARERMEKMATAKR